MKTVEENSQERIEKLESLVNQQIEQQNKILESQQKMLEMQQSFIKSNNVNNRNNDDDEKEIDILELVIVVLKKWWMILLFAAIAAGATFGFFFFTYVPSYTATARLYINNSNSTSSSSISSSDISASKSLVSTYSAVMKTHAVLDEVVKDFEGKASYDEYDYTYLVKNLKSGSVDSTEIFYVSLTDAIPEHSIRIVNSVVNHLQAQIDATIEGTTSRVFDEANVAEVDDPEYLKKSLIGAAVGAGISLVLIFLDYFVLDDKFKKRVWLEQTFPNIPVICEVPNLTPNKHSRKVNINKNAKRMEKAK